MDKEKKYFGYKITEINNKIATRLNKGEFFLVEDRLDNDEWNTFDEKDKNFTWLAKLVYLGKFTKSEFRERILNLRKLQLNE